MKLKVTIEKDGVRGQVSYDSGARTVAVDFPGPRAAAELHLTATQEFMIPESGRIDDYRVERARPTDSEMHMRLALCTLHAETGFWVHWTTLEEGE